MIATILIVAAFIAGLYIGFDRGRIFCAVDYSLTLILYYGIGVPLFALVVLCCLPFAYANDRKGRRS